MGSPADPQAVDTARDESGHPIPESTGVLVASVRSTVPEHPLDVLSAFVVPKVVDGQIADWHLTGDVVAVGGREIPQLFARWRSSWVRDWALEPLSSIRSLHAICDDILRPDERSVARTIGRILDTGEPQVVPPDELPALVHACAKVRDAVAAREATGFGIVNATPGRTASGLALAWSSRGPERVFASDDHMEVRLSPLAGLVVRWGSGSDMQEVSPTSVRLTADSMIVTAPAGDWELPHDEARPLAWLVPGATHWRVREIPEVIVWSKTFSELPDCCDYAADQGLPVELSASPETARPSV